MRNLPAPCRSLTRILIQILRTFLTKQSLKGLLKAIDGCHKCLLNILGAHHRVAQGIPLFSFVARNSSLDWISGDDFLLYLGRISFWSSVQLLTGRIFWSFDCKRSAFSLQVGNKVHGGHWVENMCKVQGT